MEQAARTTKLLLDLSTREQGGANAGKRAHLEATVQILNTARRFYLDFFLAHPDKLTERVEIISMKTGEVREGRSEEHTSELQSHSDLVCRLLLEKKKPTAARRSVR